MRMLLLVPVLTLSACGWSGDDDSTREFPVAQFNALKLTGSYDVVVAAGPQASVRAEGDERAIENLKVDVSGGELRIGNGQRGRWGWTWRWFWGLGWGRDRSHGRATIYVTTPTLARATLAGSGDMRIDRIEGDSFKMAIDGAGDVQIGALQVRGAEFSIAGAGDVTLAGKAEHTEITIAGAGDFDASALQNRTVGVTVAGAGNVAARASESATVSVTGVGDVTVKGTDKCTVSKRGLGDVSCSF